MENFITNTVPQLNGLILCGGKSSRMGRKKEEIHYHGKSQRQHLSELLAEHCREVFMSYNRAGEKHFNNQYPYIEDIFSGIGPMGGILSAFQKYPGRAWLSVACDYPLLSAQAIKQLISHRNPSKTATAFYDADGKLPEPLITIWEPRSYLYLLQFLSTGNSSLRKALMYADTELIAIHNSQELFNSNTPEECEEALKVINAKIKHS